MFTVQGLKELIVGEEQVLFQASNALSQCVKRTTSSGAPFIGSAEAVECHRLLLVASMIAEFAINYYTCILYVNLYSSVHWTACFMSIFFRRKVEHFIYDLLFQL